IRQLFRDLQQETLDVVTYRLLRCVESNLHRIDIPTADFDFNDKNFKFSLWLRVQLPIPLPNPRRPPKSRLDVAFPNVQMQVLFPTSIDCDGMAIRTMYLKYDHLSDLSPAFQMPHIPLQITQDIAEASKQEWRTKLKYKYDNRDIVEKKKDEGEEKNDEAAKKDVEEREEEKEEIGPDDEIPIVKYKKLEPTASEIAIAYEDVKIVDRWPTHVIFIELPIVYHWDEEEKFWSKKDIHDLKHNEEKGTLSFRTGAFGTFGLAALRFTNLPFQAWELKPELDGSVTFQLTAAIVMIEFNVKGGRVCINLVQNCPSKALKPIIGVYLKLYKLKRKNYSMLLVTPLKTTFVDCTEVSQVFSEDDIEGLKFSADLWNLLKITTSITVRKKIQSASQDVVYALAELLIATRVLSYS
ncbi:hypothetical protein NQ314_012940, partial [Rhamnusium bicolor]